ncbi:unnamed protein product [Vitrella brassicaformis CCMP3155]|uniref:Apple domain-containing protein n=2 Tax=Vitrella brassicaformis TaxID=1169539 RepID=A0A0G4GY87_VITBC|nr:unnamed protein product [Vitrella brassicaformis CCMP3155]|eukprot:CEM36059.1 unnamed protein product [Vitrella brassicaformis CCMP3155]
MMPRRHKPCFAALAACLIAGSAIVCVVCQDSQPDDIDSFVDKQNITLDQLNDECWVWKSTLWGAPVKDYSPISKRRVWLTDGCAEACQRHEQCKAWSFDWKGECFLLSNVTTLLKAGQSDLRNFAFVAQGKRGSRDCRPLDERRPCLEHNVKILWSDISYKYADANLTVEECRQACIKTVECRFFTLLALPGETRQCFLKNAGVNDNKLCSEYATSGFANGRDCGSPTEPLTPSEDDVKKLTSQQLFVSLDLLKKSYPPFPLFQEAYEKVNQCGCYREFTKPFYQEIEDDSEGDSEGEGDGEETKKPKTAPGSAVMLREIPTYLTPPRRCQLFCQADDRCQHWSTRWNRCFLWADVQRWLEGPDIPDLAGPKLCPRDKLEEGLRCDADFYRERYTPLSLFVLKVRDIRVPLGGSCPIEISWASLSWMLAAAILLLGTFVVAVISKVHFERRTNIVRVMIAAISMWDFLTDCAFVARSYEYAQLWVFWVGIFHLNLVIFSNSIALIYMTRSRDRQGHSFRKWMEQHQQYSHLGTLLVFVSSFLHLGVLHLFASRLFGWTLFSLEVHTKSLLTMEMLTLAEDVPQVALQAYVLLNQGSGGGGIPSVTLVSILTSIFQILKLLLFLLKYAMHSIFPSVATKSASRTAASSFAPSLRYGHSSDSEDFGGGAERTVSKTTASDMSLVKAANEQQGGP